MSPSLSNRNSELDALPTKHVFEAKVQDMPGKRVLECWMIHLGGDAYLALDEASNYFVTKDMRVACRFAISKHNDEFTDVIMQRLIERGGFGKPRRMKVRWPQGAKVTPLNEVVD